MSARRPPRLLLALALAAAGASSAAAQGAKAVPLPPEAYLLPQDSVIVVGADVHGFFASRLWSDITSGKLGEAAGLTPEKSAEMTTQVKDGFAKAMTDMEQEMGFRADRDLDWVFFALRNTDAPSPEGVAVILGRFDAARVLPAAEASQKKEGNTVSRKQVGGVSVLNSDKAGKPNFALAIVDPHHVILGDPPLVEQLLLAHQARKHPLEANAAMSGRIRGVKPGTGLFVLAGEELLKKTGQGAPMPFPMPLSVGLTFEFDGATEIAAEMATPDDAQKAVTTIQGQMGMIAGMLAQDPDPQKAVAGKMLSGISVTSAGRTLRIGTPAGTLGMGAIAAIAIPSMMRARVSANEAAAIGDVRTVISAQAAYQSTNGGFYGEMPCLSAPATCMKGYTGPQFLDAQLSSLEVKNGYRRAFHPGKKAARARSLQGFAYTAVPADQGRTGVRSFCGQDDGVIRFDPKGGDIVPVAGVCPAALEVLK